MLIFVSWFLNYVPPSFLLFLCEGLPADSLALDEQRIYWSNDNNSFLVFYVLRNNRSSLGILTSSATGSVIFALSPGQQPLPPAGNEWNSRYTCSMMRYVEWHANGGVDHHSYKHTGPESL